MRMANTKWKLQTGGKTQSGRQNLFVFHASAREILDQWEVRGYFDTATKKAIPNQDIMIMGRSLDANGNVYKILPDDSPPIDVTPQVSGKDFYTFTIEKGVKP